MNAPVWVLDTNVVVSGLLSAHGPPARLLDAALAGSLRLSLDDRIEAECTGSPPPADLPGTTRGVPGGLDPPRYGRSAPVACTVASRSGRHAVSRGSFGDFRTHACDWESASLPGGLPRSGKGAVAPRGVGTTAPNNRLSHPGSVPTRFAGLTVSGKHKFLRRKCSPDKGSVLQTAEQAKLDALVEADVQASGQRAAALLTDLRE